MDEKSEPQTTGEVAKAAATEVIDAVQDQYDHMLRAIRRSPLQAVAIAAGIGFVFALIAR